MPAVNVDAGDTAELAELLRFLHDWLAADHDHVHPSLRRFIDSPVYDIGQLRTDLARFTFLLGHDNGETLVRPRRPAGLVTRLAGIHGRPVLAPAFVEWLQGLEPGWVTDLPLPRTAQLRALGNGVVPQQATYAVAQLLADLANLDAGSTEPSGYTEEANAA
ncbi:hypothetical protein D5S19_09790 [Amycolatopsis panacis]|uniref:DNA (cytosine-5-)-methyltransferase n=2 Tax=Amycolatopsis panacis TaxID=2340917 RepID=A0A419I6T0_9PSEU|nr:hypothetical protein D5S19_09790 [Amycolatopsis panacis]